MSYDKRLPKAWEAINKNKSDIGTKVSKSGDTITGQLKTRNIIVDDGYSIRFRTKDNSTDVWGFGAENDKYFLGEFGKGLDIRGNVTMKNDLHFDAAKHIYMNGNGIIHTTNNYGIMGKTTNGVNKYMLLMDTNNRVHLGWNKEHDIVLDANLTLFNGIPQIEGANAYMYMKDTRANASPSRSYIGFGTSAAPQILQVVNVTSGSTMALNIRGDSGKFEFSHPITCNHNDIATYAGTRKGVYASNTNVGFTNETSGWLFYADNAGNCTTTGTLTQHSDIKLKKDLEIIPNAIEKISSLGGYTYTRKDNECRCTGLIAQEVQKVLPEAVISSKDKDSEDETLSVAYGNMVGLLVEGIKEQQKQINALKKKIEELEQNRPN